MTYERVKHLKPEEFKGLSGVGKETFTQMGAVLRQAKQQLKPGRPSKLSLEDKVLITLEYGVRIVPTFILPRVGELMSVQVIALSAV